MNKKRKVYQVADGFFIYKKNANAEAKKNGSEIETAEFTLETFKEKIFDFSDCEEFEEKNPDFFIELDNSDFDSALQNLPSMPGAEFVPEPNKDVIALTDLVQDLQTQILEMKTANETLKSGRVKLSFAEAEKLYSQKSELMKSIAVYSDVKEQFQNLELQDDEEGFLDLENVRLTFEAKNGYSFSSVMKTTSKLVVSEFITFIIIKLNIRILALKEEVETIDFI